jgi:hypothetical protein
MTPLQTQIADEVLAEMEREYAHPAGLLTGRVYVREGMMKAMERQANILNQTGSSADKNATITAGQQSGTDGSNPSLPVDAQGQAVGK